MKGPNARPNPGQEGTGVESPLLGGGPVKGRNRQSCLLDRRSVQRSGDESASMSN